jgi:adenylate kinase family enzyme
VHESEFVRSVRQLIEEPLTTAEWRDVFAMIDHNNNGVIELHEITDLLSSSKSQFTYEEAVQLIRQYDRTGQGTLCFDDFIDLVTNNQVVGTKLLSTYRVIFVTGGPGSGKGTVCSKLLGHVDCAHISSGDLLRQEIQAGTLLGQQIESTVKSGGLVDASTVVALLDKALARSTGKYVLLDGFPRSRQNALDFYELFGPAQCVLSFECPHDVMLQRILDRGKTSGRADDNYETAQKRISTFHEQSAGPMEVFKEKGCPIVSLDATKPVEHNVNRLLELPMFKALVKAS